MVRSGERRKGAKTNERATGAKEDRLKNYRWEIVNRARRQGGGGKGLDVPEQNITAGEEKVWWRWGKKSW